MPLQRAKEKKTEKCRIGLVFLQKRSAYCLEKLLVIHVNDWPGVNHQRFLLEE